MCMYNVYIYIYIHIRTSVQMGIETLACSKSRSAAPKNSMNMSKPEALNPQGSSPAMASSLRSRREQTPNP